MKYEELKVGSSYDVNYVDKVKEKSYKGSALCIKVFDRAKTAAFAISNYKILILYPNSVEKISTTEKKISKVFLKALLKKLES